MKPAPTLELQKTANEVRKGIVIAVHAAKSGHPGGSLSAAEIFTYLYFEEMNIDPENPKNPDRDRFVLSKGHAAPGLYSVMAERGYFPKEELATLRHLGSRLQGHPCMQYLPGIDMSKPVRWDRESPRRAASLWQARSITGITVSIRRLATASARKDRSGRRPCLRARRSWTTFV